MKKMIFSSQSKCSFLLGAAMGFMFCVFAPLDTFFANKDEFWFSLSQLLPVLIVTFIGFVIVFFVISLLCSKSRVMPYVYGFLLYAYLYFYIQGNYIPRNYGVMNGIEIDWSSYVGYGLASIIVAGFCLLVYLVSVIKFKSKIYHIGKYLCMFIMLIQVVTIGVVWLRDSVTKRNYEPEKFVVTNKDLLNLSEDKNILVFLLDSFDAGSMFDLLQGGNAEEYWELFRGFTFYPDTLGCYPTTKGAMPYILTGVWYHNEKPYTEYVRDAYDDNSIYKALRKNNFSIGVYTSDSFMNNKPDMYTNVDTGTYFVNDYGRFVAKIYQLVAFNYMPHQLKRYFNLETGEFDLLKETKSLGGAYSFDVQENYALLLEQGVSVTEQGNCFRFYHTDGIHAFHTFGKDLVTEEGVTYTQYDEAEGNCTYLEVFFEKMKEKGIYDDATIIIMADHGCRGYWQNPVFMIKNAGDEGDLLISGEKMSYEYLADIYISLANGEKITEEYIRNCDKGEKRRFLYYTWDSAYWTSSYMPPLQEMYVDGYAGDSENLYETGQEYIGQDEQ